MEVVRGETVSMVGETMFSKIHTGLQPLTLTGSSAELRNYTGEPQRVLGTIHVPVVYGKLLVRLPMMVLEAL